jgi:uncharacterized tellurite resistance protein B-like protein
MTILDAYMSVGLKRDISHFANMVKIAKSDKVITKEEEELLKKIARKYDIGDEKFKEILSNPESIPTIAHLNCEERIEKLFDLITMIYSDHKKAIEEVSVLKKIVIGLGFPLQNIDKIVEFAVRIDNENYDLESFKKEILKANQF